MHRTRGFVTLGWLALISVALLVAFLAFHHYEMTDRACFYGVVLDASGRPVKDAHVDVSVTYLGPKSRPSPFGGYLRDTKTINLVTDADGRFMVIKPWTETYDAAFVYRIAHASGSWKGPARPVVGSAAAKACVFLLRRKPGMEGGEDVHVPDASRPVPFVLRPTYASALLR